MRKVVEFDELLEVSHSLFIISSAGSGKPEIWIDLSHAKAKRGTSYRFVDINLKTVTNKKLFGFLIPVTRVWQDGLFSIITHYPSNLAHANPKSIVLDGYFDPCRVESHNTIMEDNKVLMLASNVKIALTIAMRLIFKILRHKCATPFTVLFVGILFVNGTNKQFHHVIPITNVAMAEMLCRLLEGLLAEQNVPPNSDGSLYELYFVFTVVWGFGGPCDDMSENRTKFKSVWSSE